jgi:hypothetical protein
MKYTFLWLIVLLGFSSCKQKQKQTLADKQKEIGTGTLDAKNIYTSDKIGWTVMLPEGWDVETKEGTKKSTEKGTKLIEKTMNTEIDASALEQLINIKKDRFNSFLSTIEPYDEKEAGPYADNNQEIYGILKKTYAGQKIYAEYDEGTTTIDGLTFYTFMTTIYSSDKSKIILFQKMYSRLVNGYDLGMTINYNNDADQKTLESMVQNSHFTKRD